MPDGMAGVVAKGTVLIAADSAFNNRDSRNAVLHEVERQIRLIGERGNGSVTQLLELVTPLPREVLQHFREHIFNDEPPGWWPWIPHKDEIVLRGLHKALTMAIEGDLEIDSYWVCTGHMFQTVLMRSRHEVNMLYLTPPMPGNLFYPSVTVPDDIWITCSESDAVMIREMSSYPLGDVLGNPIGRPRPPEELPDIDPGLPPDGPGGVQIVRPKRAM